MPYQRYAYHFGIEEEFFLVNPITRNAVPQVPKQLVRTCQARYGAHVHHEMLQSQVEISTPVLGSADEARARLEQLRHGLIRVAEDMDLRVVAAGTHPLAGWHEQRHTDKPRYDALIDDFQMIGRRNLLCALHVHVAVPSGVDRVVLMNRLMGWLPLFLGLSASSPFWNRQRTGLLSYRQAAYDEWPRTGIPDHFRDESEYADFVALLERCGAVPDGSFLWWAIRPSPRYPTLELRIADSCPRLADSLAIAAAYRCLVRAYTCRPGLAREWTPLTRRVIDENRWRAKRYGTAAQFIDEAAGYCVSFADSMERLIALIEPDIAALDCAAEIQHLRQLARHGSSADAQLAIYHRHRDRGASRTEALRHVVDWLIVTTAQAADLQ